jgi:hypothetical protein
MTLTGGGGYSGSGVLNMDSEHTPLINIELIDYIWAFENGMWTPHKKTIPTGESYLHISDTTYGLGTDVFLILIDEQNKDENGNYRPKEDPLRYSPLLGVSTGFVVKKDIACGGYLSANQGLIVLGSGMTGPFDPPGAWLMHANNKKINFKGNNSPPSPKEGWRWIDTSKSITSGNLTFAPLKEYQQGGWQPLKTKDGYDRMNAMDNGYSFGSSLPSWGSDHLNEWFIVVNSSGTGNHGHIYKRISSGWWDGGNIDDPNLPYSGFFDTFEFRRTDYEVPLRPQDYVHIRCANITAHHTNPAADLAYGLGSPDRRWLGICADTIYADHIKDLNGNDFNFGGDWDGGTVKNSITIYRSDPQLHLNATDGNSANGNASIHFYDGSVSKMILGYSKEYDQLYINDDLPLSQNGKKTILTLTHNGNMGLYGDLYAAGKIILRSNLPILDFAPPGLPAGQEYSARFTNTQNGRLQLDANFDVLRDFRVMHNGNVLLELNSTNSQNAVVNLSRNSNVQAMFGVGTDNRAYINTSNNIGLDLRCGTGGNINILAPLQVNSSYGTKGQILTSNGDNTVPSWQNASGNNNWNGGTVTNSITIQRADPQLHLNATSGNPALYYYDGSVQKMALAYNAAYDYLYIYDTRPANDPPYGGGQKLLLNLDHWGNMGLLGDFALAGKINLEGASPIINWYNNKDHTSHYAMMGYGVMQTGYSATFFIASRTNADFLIASQQNRNIVLAPSTMGGDGSGQVEIAGAHSLRPQTSNTGTIGQSGRYWYETWTNYLYATNVYPRSNRTGYLGDQNHIWESSAIQNLWYKNDWSNGCERSKANQEWPHQYSDYWDAAEELTHEMTKTKYHTPYDPDSDDKLVCVCGKKASAPCPEHQAQWNDRYGVNMTKVKYGAAYLALEHAAALVRLTQQNMQLEERIAELEAKLTRLLSNTAN